MEFIYIYDFGENVMSSLMYINDIELDKVVGGGAPPTIDASTAIVVNGEVKNIVDRPLGEADTHEQSANLDFVLFRPRM